MRNRLRHTLPIVILLLGGMLVLNLLFTRTAAVPDVFVDSPSFTEAIERSTETDKPVLVLATADWCMPCQNLKRHALRDSRVAQAIRNRVIPVYLDVTRDAGDAYEVAEALGVMQIPALILVQGGEEIKRIEGDRSALELLSWLRAIEPAAAN